MVFLGRVTKLVPVVPVVVAHKALEVLAQDQELQVKDLTEVREVRIALEDIQRVAVVVLARSEEVQTGLNLVLVAQENLQQLPEARMAAAAAAVAMVAEHPGGASTEAEVLAVEEPAKVQEMQRQA